MPVSDIMTREVILIDMDESVRAARDLLAERGIHHLVVSDGTKPVGVISDRDILRTISPFAGKFDERVRDAASLNKRIHQVMTRSMIFASPDQSIAEAGRIMLERGISCLPVISGRGRLAGIVTDRDIMAWFISRAEVLPKAA
jgi:acetoin utilization protein AcuB